MLESRERNGKSDLASGYSTLCKNSSHTVSTPEVPCGREN